MSQILLTADDRARLRAEHAQVFHRSFGRRYGLALGVVLTVAYLIFCWFFFGIGPAFQNGKWDRAAIFVQDWYSWRAQPRLRFGEDGSITPQWSSRGQYADGAAIDWLTPNVDGSTTVTYDGPGNRLDITTTAVTAWVDGNAYTITIAPDIVTAPANAPAAIEQDGPKVMVRYGFAGQAEIRDSQVYVQRRFLGWANFLFDPQSVFWHKPFTELVALAVSPDRIDPKKSNLELMLSDFWNNRSWQHGDIFAKLLQTLVMAFVGTLLATLVAFPLAFIAARNITPNRANNWQMKRFFDFIRSIDMLIWALFFTRGFGPGPIPGIAAIFFTDTGALGKVYAEALENVDDKQREGVKSVGASAGAVNRYGVVPQVLPVFISQSLYFWESNTRSATVIGAVGAGGIGLKLLEAMGTNSDWDKVAYMVLLILGVVFVFDNISNAIRSRLIGPTGH
jgi:phosphonate transport system permease protein